MPRTIKGMHLHQVLLQVRDVERSREFYTKKLGFRVLYDYSPHYLAVVTPNRLQIGLHPFEKSIGKTTTKEKSAGIEFEVDNVDSWYQKLKKRGVRFSERPRDSWGEREARFKDPDGYTLAISSPVKSKR
jgi:catechol 2,3-dioxygenase-like lactoylglutathione lyase family enzyme